MDENMHDAPPLLPPTSPSELASYPSQPVQQSNSVFASRSDLNSKALHSFQMGSSRSASIASTDSSSSTTVNSYTESYTSASSDSGTSMSRSATSTCSSQTDTLSTPQYATKVAPDTAADVTAFRMPQHHQAQSPLLSMPPEIRTKILRYLLKRDTIEDITDFKAQTPQQDESAIVSTYRKEVLSLSSQVMSVCQKLNAEAAHILYAENIICLSSTSCRGDATAKLAVFDTGFEVATEHVMDPTMPFSIQIMHRSHVDASSIKSFGKNSAEVSLFEKTLKRFKKFNLMVDGPTWFQHSTLFALTRSLATLLQGKEVQLFFGPELGVTADNWYKEAILQCQGLCCRKFTVVNKCSALLLDEDVVSRISKAVESNELVTDTYPYFVSFSNMVYRYFPASSAISTFTSDNYGLIQEASALASSYAKPERVQDIVTELAAKVIKKVEDCVVERAEVIVTAKQQVNRAEQELDNAKTAQRLLVNGLKDFQGPGGHCGH